MIFAILAAILLGAVLTASYWAYRVAFYVPRNHQEDIYHLPSGAQNSKHQEKMRSCIKKLNDLPYESVTITSQDGKTLFGRYYHTRDGAPVQIQFHGYRGSAMRDFCGGTPLAQHLGHNALVVDQRCHGRSQGHTITFGVRERYDCQSWANYAYQRFGPNTPLILSGVSMGAATVLMASNLKLPETVCGVVADCPYSSPRDIILKVAGEMGLPKKPAGWFCLLGARLYGRFSVKDASAVESVKGTHLPVLLLHGEDDQFVPCHMSREIYAACGSDKQLVTFPNAGHGMSYLEDPQRYEAAVSGFLKHCIEACRA